MLAGCLGRLQKTSCSDTHRCFSVDVKAGLNKLLTKALSWEILALIAETFQPDGSINSFGDVPIINLPR